MFTQFPSILWFRASLTSVHQGQAGPPWTSPHGWRGICRRFPAAGSCGGNPASSPKGSPRQVPETRGQRGFWVWDPPKMIENPPFLKRESPWILVDKKFGADFRVMKNPVNRLGYKVHSREHKSGAGIHEGKLKGTPQVINNCWM